MGANNNHGGKRPGAGRKRKWDPIYEVRIISECENLYNEAVQLAFDKEKQRKFGKQSELNYFWKKINNIPVEQRSNFLKDAAYQTYIEYFNAEVELIKSNDDDSIGFERVIKIDVEVPRGTIQKIINQVSEKYSLDKKEVENAWGAHKRKNINKI